MAFALTWLAEVLEAAGLKIAEQPGWRDRGRGEMGTVRGVICHHTAGPKSGIMPSLGICINGRSDLPGPLSQLCLGRDGTYFIVAAGRCNHAGAGSWQGITTGNSSFIGIEAENTGFISGPKADPWPDVQLDAYRRGVAAILKKIGANPIMAAGHKEYAPTRKDDPSFDMAEFRNQVTAIMGGTAIIRDPIPHSDPGTGRPTLRRGARDELVKKIQLKVGVEVDGVFGPRTEAAVRQFQREHDLVPDGIVGPKTWAVIDGAPDRPEDPGTPVTGPFADIIQIAGRSDISRFFWKNRGVAPAGYIKGLALAYARVHSKLKAGDPAAVEMAKAKTNDPNKDALAWYDDIFAAAGMSNSVAGPDTLRHLFVLMMGLGMRESSGKHCEGRDRSASNTTADSAEAGLFQTSFNARSASPLMPALFTKYSANPSGFLDVFKEGVHCSDASLENFGTGPGRDFQKLSKECPAFAAEFAAVGLRNIRTHWGPITRREAEVRQAADAMLQQVQVVVDGASTLGAALIA